jgi:hypothetical protein
MESIGEGGCCSIGLTDVEIECHMIFSGPIEAFFKAPIEPPCQKGDCLLYYLRSDLESLYGSGATSSSVSPSHALLATLGILNGIDYLSQVYSTQTKQRGRFVETLKDLLNLSPDDSEALYQLRCAVVHQIGPPVVSESYRRGTRFTFELTDAPGQPVIRKQSDSGTEVSYSVGFWALKASFVAIVGELHRICRQHGRPNALGETSQGLRAAQQWHAADGGRRQFLASRERSARPPRLMPSIRPK